VQQRLVNGWRAAAGMAATAVLGLLAAGVLLATAPATGDETTAADASTFAGFTLPDLTNGPAALGFSTPAAHDTTDRAFTPKIVVGQDTLHLQFNDPVVEQHADSSAALRFRGEPSVRVFIRDDSLRALRAEDFAFVVDSLREGGLWDALLGLETFGESLGTLGQGLEVLMDSLDTSPQAFEGRLWWDGTPPASPDTLEIRSWGGLSPEERRAQLDSLMAQAHALWQPSPEQQARRDSLMAQARTFYEPSPEQQARIDSLRSRLREFTTLTPERRARMDSLTAMLRDLQRPSAEQRARVDSLMARAQALVRPTEEQQAQLDSLQALIQHLARPSSEQLRQRAEALREQAERLEAQAQALEQEAPPPPTDRPPPPTPPERN
jgi:polyhydroxyalkanoate synthesis regulator phasin